MRSRICPAESAALFNIGVTKKGIDGNMWIVTASKMNIKRWKPHKVNNSDKILSTLSFYEIQPIKKYEWSKWEKNLTAEEKIFVAKVRSSYIEIEKETGIKVLECILPLNIEGLYCIDYVWDYAKIQYPNICIEKIPIMIVIIKLSIDMFFDIKKNEDTMIFAQHSYIGPEEKNKFFKFIENFNKTKYGKIEWNGSTNKTISFVL
jgi:hypothetical protein